MFSRISHSSRYFTNILNNSFNNYVNRINQRFYSKPFIFKKCSSYSTNNSNKVSSMDKKGSPHDKYVKYIDNNGIETKETITTKQQFSNNICGHILENKTVSVLGYGPQGRAQALNLKDSSIDVIVGVRRKGDSWMRAKQDGWTPGVNLFEIDEASFRGDIIKYLLSDSGQIKQWGCVKNNLNMGDTLYFSHGFGIHYYNYTNINPPDDVNVIMVSPKCSGNTVRTNYLNKKGFASSYAIYKDVSDAENICKALAFSIGNNYIFETTFENEVVSDLTGERCVLMGLIQGAFLAQYNVLRKNGHSPLEAYHETVEEALQSLYPLINEKGMDWMFQNCSTTAQRGALDWAPKFEETLTPRIEECYQNVKDNSEVERVITSNNSNHYRDELNNELNKISKQEIWDIGKQLRGIKSTINPEPPKNNTKTVNNNYHNDQYNDTSLRWNGIYYDKDIHLL